MAFAVELLDLIRNTETSINFNNPKDCEKVAFLYQPAKGNFPPFEELLAEKGLGIPSHLSIHDVLSLIIVGTALQTTRQLSHHEQENIQYNDVNLSLLLCKSSDGKLDSPVTHFKGSIGSITFTGFLAAPIKENPPKLKGIPLFTFFSDSNTHQKLGSVRRRDYYDVENREYTAKFSELVDFIALQIGTVNQPLTI